MPDEPPAGIVTHRLRQGEAVETPRSVALQRERDGEDLDFEGDQCSWLPSRHVGEYRKVASHTQTGVPMGATLDGTDVERSEAASTAERLEDVDSAEWRVVLPDARAADRSRAHADRFSPIRRVAVEHVGQPEKSGRTRPQIDGNVMTSCPSDLPRATRTDQRESMELVTSPPVDGTSAASTPFAGGRVMGIGSLPHRDQRAAAAFAIGEFEIATIPTLPRRSPAEGMIARAIVGLPGVSLGQYGSVAVDPTRLGDDVPIVTALDGDAFVGLRAFLELADAINIDGQPVAWQFVGPVTLGVALQRAGLRTADAFTIAADAVRQHLVHISELITSVLPNSPQMMVLDEPWLVDLMGQDFPVPAGEAVDLISTAMAAVSGTATVGLHCCGPCDIATMLASGPQLISVATTEHLLDFAGYLARFLRDGGTIAWGVVPTDGPALTSATRQRRALDALWEELVERGVDAHALRAQSLFTTVCGLDGHHVSVARRLARITAEIGRGVRDPGSIA